MFKAIIESLPEMIRNHARMTLFVMLCVSSGVAYSVATFASKDDLLLVKVQVMDLGYKIDRRQLEQKIYSIESEIFSLERIVANGTGRADDYERLSKLRSELGSTNRDLARLERKGFIN